MPCWILRTRLCVYFTECVQLEDHLCLCMGELWVCRAAGGSWCASRAWRACCRVAVLKVWANECTVGTETLGFWSANVRIWLQRTGNARERLWDVMWSGDSKDRTRSWLGEPGFIGKKSSCRQEKGLKTGWALQPLGSPPFSLEPCFGENVGNLAVLAV